MAITYTKSNHGPADSTSGVFSASGGVNYAGKYADKIDERFKLQSIVAPATNNDFKFNGVNSVTVFNIDTVALNNYAPAGSNRFGSPPELGNGEQTLTIMQDKAFTFDIDNRSSIATNGAMVAAQALKREIDEVCVPTYDKYVLQKLYDTATAYQSGKNVVTPSAAVTKDTAYTEFLKAQNAMGNAHVPLANRTAFVTYEFYSFFKAGGFTLASEAGQKIHQTGDIGKVDGTRMILTPSDYMPSNVLAIVIASNLVIAPRPINYFTVHTNPVGLHGWRIEGRMVYDCFVLNNKREAIYVLKQKTS